MDSLELFHRVGVAIAIGAIVGVERHWRERDDAAGSRTAGVRTFTLIGMLGGGVGVLEHAIAALSGPAGLITAGVFCTFAAIFAWFKRREAEAEHRFSATTVIAAMVTFVLGAMAVIGDMRLAAAGGVALTAILASRDMLHGFMKTLTWPELRSAIVLLAMTFVILPLVPDHPIGPFGGISPAQTWGLAVLLAAISFVGYVAVKTLGGSRGEAVAGAIGGLLSSTAVTIANARKAATGGAARPLAAGTAAAGAVSYLRTAALTVALAPAVAASAVAPLIAAALTMTLFAVALARQTGADLGAQPAQNPLDLPSVIKATVLLVAVAFLARAASAAFGASGLVAVSALSGLADVDAVTVTVGGLLRQGLGADAGFSAIAASVIANTVGKMAYAAALGGRSFAAWFALACTLAIGAAVAVHFVIA